MNRERTESQRRLKPGDTFPRLEFAGAIGGVVAIPPERGYIHVQLRRFAGCMVCNVHLRQVVRRLPDIRAAGVEEVVVFHSTQREVIRYESELPLVVVADPKKELYRRFGVERSTMALLGAWRTLPRAVVGAAMTAVRTGQLPPLSPTGGELGRPADFLIDKSGRVVAVKYGTHAGDQWSVDDLLRIVAADSAES
ncbi:MAG: AhpC/TSA family protein [Microbacteriaceae bacterium]